MFGKNLTKKWQKCDKIVTNILQICDKNSQQFEKNLTKI